MQVFQHGAFQGSVAIAVNLGVFQKFTGIQPSAEFVFRKIMIILSLDFPVAWRTSRAGDGPDKVGLLSECRAEGRLSCPRGGGNDKEYARTVKMEDGITQGLRLVREFYRVPPWIARPVVR